MKYPVPDTGRRTGLVALVLCLLLAVPLSACSADRQGPAADAARGGAAGGESASGSTSGSVALASAQVETRARFHRVHGRLPVARRKAVRHQVTAVVERWWDAAYLGGDYPRTDFRDAFPGFTRGARARARRDLRLMSNRDVGARVDEVAADRRLLRLDVLAVDRRARAVTARFVLRFATTSATTGERDGTTVVRGRLFLTRRHGPWRVFGYDVSKGARP